MSYCRKLPVSVRNVPATIIRIYCKVYLLILRTTMHIFVVADSAVLVKAEVGNNAGNFSSSLLFVVA